MKTRFFWQILSITASFCQISTVFGQNALPTEYRKPVLDLLRNELRDPRGVRDASISRPFLRNMGVQQRYVVCVRLNAKNQFGGYSGLTDLMVVFLDGRPIGSPMAADFGECRGANFSKFHELEKIP